jgi:hypothetical protein
MRGPVCALEESIIAHSGFHVLGDAEIFQKTRVCLGCGLTFAEATPERDWTALETMHESTSADETLRRDEIEELDELDARWIGLGGGRRVLAVGQATAPLLARLAASGWCAASSARDTAVADLVILADILQRSPTPLALLAHVRALLTESGTLFLRVPELTKVSCTSPRDAFTPEHRVWFTPDSLRITLAHAGFRISRSETDACWLRATATPASPNPSARGTRTLARIVRHYSRHLAAPTRPAPPSPASRLPFFPCVLVSSVVPSLPILEASPPPSRPISDLTPTPTPSPHHARRRHPAPHNAWRMSPERPIARHAPEHFGP